MPPEVGHPVPRSTGNFRPARSGDSSAGAADPLSRPTVPGCSRDATWNRTPPLERASSDVPRQTTCYARVLTAWTPGLTAPVLATVVGVSGAVLGLWLTG